MWGRNINNQLLINNYFVKYHFCYLINYFVPRLRTISVMV